MTYAFLFFLFWSTDKNYIKSSVNLAGVKKNAISKELDINRLKDIGKRHNATLNDVVLALIGISVKEYLV